MVPQLVAVRECLVIDAGIKNHMRVDLRVGIQVRIVGVGNTVLPHLREGGADVVLGGSRDELVAALVAYCVFYFSTLMHSEKMHIVQHSFLLPPATASSSSSDSS